MFKITDSKGFHITFTNGWTVSVQFGFGNYGDNYDDRSLCGRDSRNDVSSNRVEVAVWDADHNWCPDQRFSYIPADKVLAIMNAAAIGDRDELKRLYRYD